MTKMMNDTNQPHNFPRVFEVERSPPHIQNHGGTSKLWRNFRDASQKSVVLVEPPNMSTKPPRKSWLRSLGLHPGLGGKFHDFKAQRWHGILHDVDLPILPWNAGAWSTALGKQIGCLFQHGHYAFYICIYVYTYPQTETFAATKTDPGVLFCMLQDAMKGKKIQLTSRVSPATC